MNYINRLQSFLVEQVFLSIIFTTTISNLLTSLALCGQMDTQRIHDIQTFLSTFDGLPMSMAETGHREAQRPHLVHALVALGTIPIFPALRYGLWPGNAGVEKSFCSSFPPIFSAKSFYCL